MIFLEKPKEFNDKLEIVSCFFEHDGKILLLHRQDHKPQGNTWAVPAGKVEANENLSVAMARELAEETGYCAKPEEFIFVKTVYVKFPDFDFVYHMFKLILAEKHEIVIEEKAHKGFQWITPKDALQRTDLILDEDDCIRLVYNIS